MSIDRERHERIHIKRSLLVLGLVVVLVAGFALAYLLLTPEAEWESGGMGGMEPVSGPDIPLVGGYAEGEEIAFLHTEASAAQVAEMLTEMMGSPVLAVPSLADVPEAARANVYVFTNGIEGDGSMGFQPDVFDNPPGTESYSPLRTLNLVTWVNASDARARISRRGIGGQNWRRGNHRTDRRCLE